MTDLVIWLWNRFEGPIKPDRTMNQRVEILLNHFSLPSSDLSDSESAFKRFLAELTSADIAVSAGGNRCHAAARDGDMDHVGAIRGTQDRPGRQVRPSGYIDAAQLPLGYET
jgi:hypothetical protein